MKKVIYFFVFLCLINVSFAQGLRLGIGGGLSIVTGPSGLTDALSNTATIISSGAGFGSEFNIAVKGKLNIPMVPITPTGFIQYHFLNASANLPILGDVESSMNVLSLGVGGELSLYLDL